MINLFSESVNIEVSDIMLIMGSSKHQMSRDVDFNQDPVKTYYDAEDQLTNIVMRTEADEEFLKPERQKLKEKKRLEKEKRR